MQDRRSYLNQPRSPSSSSRLPCPNEEFGTRKTVIVLVIIVGCFAVVWPKLLYPMLVGNTTPPAKQNAACCDVISELDVDTIKIMTELCRTIIEQPETTVLSPREIVSHCKKTVIDKCGIDLSAALKDRVFLGHSTKQILEEVRSLNGSMCLKYYFGVAPWKLGVPHRITLNLDMNTIKQERPLMTNPVKVHPALKERGKAIYGADQVTTEVRRKRSSPIIVEGRPGPIPGRRPSGVVPGQIAPSKISNYGLMGILMPIYTIAFIIFFTYIVKQIVYKKKPDTYVGSPLYPPCDSDEQFEQHVFQAQQPYFSRPNKDSSQIVVNAVAALLEEVNQAVEEHENKLFSQTATEQSEIKVNGAFPKDEEQNSVTIMGMETRASCEHGGKWSRPDSPVLHYPQVTVPKELSVTTQQIFLEGSLPPQSQILVADSATEAQTSEGNDSSVILAGKMTLSVISLDSEPGTERLSNFGRRNESSDEERRTSSNLLEEFEKINPSDLEDEIDNIIEEAGNAVLHEDIRTLAHFDSPQSNEVTVCNTLHDRGREFNLTGNFIQALKDDEAESSVILTDCLDMEKQVSTTYGSQYQKVGEKDKRDYNAELEQTKKTSNEDTISITQKDLCEELNVRCRLDEPSIEEILQRELGGFREAQVCNEVVLGLLEDHNDQSMLGVEEDFKEKTPDYFPNRKPSKEQESGQAMPEEAGSEDRVTDNIECESEGNNVGEAELTDNVERDVLVEEKVNGLRTDPLNDSGNIEILAGNDNSEGYLDDEEELEEIIEYVDNTDEEGEEIVEINGNENQQINDNGTN